METPSEIGIDTMPVSTPHLNMEFETVEDAWKFWTIYGGQMGFHVRKRFANKNNDNVVTSKCFVCGNEGHRRMDNRNRTVKKPRAEVRTNCPVRLKVKLIKKTGKYIVYDFVAEHNHDLQGAEAIQLIIIEASITVDITF